MQGAHEPPKAGEAFSHEFALLDVCIKGHLGDKSKNSPLVNAPSPLGFSIELFTCTF